VIVREVRLENVKSYGSPAEIIRLSRGVNAVCGPNGAGKSTVLEAIGCALFQYLPYRHEDFVREGETSGTITVVVESRLDQRTYEVVRRVGRGSKQYVFDPDIAQQIAVGEADVRHWLHDHLRIDDEVDLRALFIDSVGPPQGTLTAAFLESPLERRAKFNRLLRVEEYEHAYHRLAALDGALTDERHEIEIAIARLEPQTEGRHALELEQAELRDRQYDLVVQLRRNLAERASLEREIESLARAEQGWRTAETALNLALERQRSADEIHDRARAEHARAEAARATCDRTRPGRDGYAQAMERLQSLEAAQRERDRLRQDLHRAELEAQRLRGEVGRLDGEIVRAEQAAHDVTELRKKIPEQEAAEKRLQAAKDAKSEADQLRKRITGLEGQLARAGSRVKQAEKDVAEALEHHSVADQLPARRASHHQLAEALAAANRAEGELRALRAGILQRRQLVARLEQQLGQVELQVGAAAGNEERAATLAIHEANHRRIADDRAAATSQLAHATATREQVGGGLCPFLHEACRNLRPGVTLETHFDAEIERWTDAFVRLDREIQAIDREVQSARDARSRAATLPQLREQRDRLMSDLTDGTAGLADDEKRLQAAAHLASQKTDAERAEQAASHLVREAERAAQEVTRLTALRQAALDATGDRAAIEVELATNRARNGELQGTLADLAGAAAALTALGSPREKAEHLRLDAAKLLTVQTQRQKANVDLEQATARIERITRNLEPYAELDQHLDGLRQQRDRLRSDYEAFAAASVLAEGLDERAAALRAADAQATAARDRVAEARQAMDDAATSYDTRSHQRAIERRGEVDTAIGDVQAHIHEAERDEQRLDAEIEKAHELELELAAQRRLVERIDDERQLATVLRQSIRAAGPEITRQLLSRISRMASRINAEVLNQSGVELEWTPDYEIVTKRQGETRGFAQLSGGEQMAAALAVRLAILRDLSNVRMAFLDEPTAHLDQERRSNLGDQVQRLQGFDQLVVISHDDTFDGLFGHVIRIGRENGRSRVLDQN